jgi:hypothetical protein
MTTTPTEWEVWQGDQWHPATGDEAKSHIRSFINRGDTLPAGAYWLPWHQVARDKVAADVVPGDILIHHKGVEYLYGRDAAGHDVEVQRKTGRVKRLYTQAERKAAVAAHDGGEGYGTIAARLHATKSTVQSWCRRAEDFPVCPRCKRTDESCDGDCAPVRNPDGSFATREQITRMSRAAA